MMTVRQRLGMTLMELVVALTVGAMVLAAATTQVRAITIIVSRAAQARADRQERGIADRVIQDLFAGMTRPTTAVPFAGSDSVLLLPYRTERPGGDTVVRAVLRLDALGVLAVNAPGHAPLVLQRHVHRISFDYLAARGLDSRWMSAFTSGGSLPEAVRLRVWSSVDTARCDTVLFLGGPAR